MKFILNIISGLVSITVILSCVVEKMEQGDLMKKQGAEHSPERNAQIQQNNLEIQKELAANRYPCNVIVLKENVLDKHPDETYLVNFDKLLS